MTVFLHSGYAAELGGVDCYTGASASQRIASHSSTFYFKSGTKNTYPSWISQRGYTVGFYVVASAYRGTCRSNTARIGTITHEMFHHFGVPDLFDVQGPYHNNSNGSIVGGLGNYDIMVRFYQQRITI